MFVVSFYSYKGGVGRSVALLNVAWHLASRGVRVALLDLDLEAPGLQHAFLQKGKSGEWEPPVPKRGFVDLVRDYLKSRQFNVKEKLTNYLTEGLGPEGKIGLLAAKAENDGQYQRFLQEFSWPEFYANEERPGKVVTASVVVGLSERAYDYLLIDARTGLTDVRGVTLIDMPDLVVAVTNLSRQSAEGIREQLAQIEALNSLIREQKSCLSRRPGREQIPIQTLVVGAPLPVGEWRHRQERVKEIEKQMQRPFDVQIDYLPLLALEERSHIVAQLAQPDGGSMIYGAASSYETLTEAIVTRNPEAPENLNAQGDKLQALGRWREALAHYDEVGDRAAALTDKVNELMWQDAVHAARAGKVRSQLVAVTQIDRALDELNKLEHGVNGNGHLVPVKRLIELRLAAAWSLVVAERFDDAVRQALSALKLARAKHASHELIITCAFVLGQAQNFAGSWTNAAATLEEADKLCIANSTQPLMHALVLVEQARVAAAAGPVKDGQEAVERASKMVSTAPIKSTYIKARIQLAEGEIFAEAARGYDAVSTLRKAKRAFETENDRVGVLEAMLVLATLELKSELSIDDVKLAESLSMRFVADRLRAIMAGRALAAGKTMKAEYHLKLQQVNLEPSVFSLLERCRCALINGKLPEARKNLSAAERISLPTTHENILLAELLGIALGKLANSSPRFKRHIAHLEKSGMRTRLLQAFFVQAMHSSANEPKSTTNAGVDAFRALSRNIPDLDKWLWNLPIAFLSRAKGFEEAFKRVQKQVNIHWPEPIIK